MLSDKRMREAAIALLIESGIKGTTLAAIGERAGYSRALVTHRFRSKAGLLAYVHDTAVAAWVVRVHDAVGDRTGVDALRRVIDAVYGFIAQEPDEVRAMYLLRYASIDPSAEFRASVASAHAAQRRDVQRWIEIGQAQGSVASRVDAMLAAELFCSTVDGLIYRWLITPSLPIHQLRDALQREVERGMQCTEAGAAAGSITKPRRLRV